MSSAVIYRGAAFARTFVLERDGVPVDLSQAASVTACIATDELAATVLVPEVTCDPGAPNADWIAGAVTVQFSGGETVALPRSGTVQLLLTEHRYGEGGAPEPVDSWPARLRVGSKTAVPIVELTYDPDGDDAAHQAEELAAVKAMAEQAGGPVRVILTPAEV